MIPSIHSYFCYAAVRASTFSWPLRFEGHIRESHNQNDCCMKEVPLGAFLKMGNPYPQC